MMRSQQEQMSDKGTCSPIHPFRVLVACKRGVTQPEAIVRRVSGRVLKAM